MSTTPTEPQEPTHPIRKRDRRRRSRSDASPSDRSGRVRLPGVGARSRFAGGDQGYLKAVQYRDSSKLAARAQLHAKYGRGDWFVWWARQVEWPPSGAVLEIGCGAGWLWASAVAEIPPGLQLTLTDQSSGMVAEAVAAVASLEHYASVEGATVDAQHLPYDDDSFDVVVANHMLYHLPDPALGVAELARVLRPSGTALIATNGVGHLREIGEVQAAVFPGAGLRDETVAVFGLESGAPIIDEHFADVTLLRYPDHLRCTDPKDVLAFVTSTPPAEDATSTELEGLRAAIDERMRANDGVFEVTKAVGLFIACDPSGAT